jgi:hypothetical protein
MSAKHNTQRNSFQARNQWPKPEIDLDRSISKSHASSDPQLRKVFLRGKCGLRIEIPQGRFTKQISAVDSKREDLIRQSKAPELGR